MDVDLEEIDELQKSGLSWWRMYRALVVVFAFWCWCAHCMLHIVRRACARTMLQFCVLTVCLCECLRLEVCSQDQRRRISAPKLSISSSLLAALFQMCRSEQGRPLPKWRHRLQLVGASLITYTGRRQPLRIWDP